ncbi:MAG: hypothetical protein R2687_01385 [Candidatus Nanopelagicales bacterium]
MGEPWADHERLVDAADLFAEKVDVLLDRVVDNAIGRCRAHSPEQLRQENVERLLTRIAIGHRAGFDPAVDVRRALRAGLGWEQIGEATGLGTVEARRRWSPKPTPGRPAQRSRRCRKVDENQMTMW